MASQMERPLRIAVLGDFDGIHTRRWLEYFVERGHQMHAISFHRPQVELPGVMVHVLSGDSRSADSARKGEVSGAWLEASARSIAGRLPRDLLRLAHAQRYMRAGLGKVLAEIQPDVFHAHYVVEHGFFGSLADFHPYVVSAWGSDLLVDSRRFGGRQIARLALGKADLVTANDVSLARRAMELGVCEEKVEVVHLGIDRVFLEAGERSVNLTGEDVPPTVISDRALEPLYHVEIVMRAFADVRERLPEARLVVAGTGSEQSRLRALAESLGVVEAVRLVGQQSSQDLADLLAASHVYVSVPSSDSLALSTVEAMATGCFPVVSDMASNAGWIDTGVNGLVVAPGDVTGLAAAIQAGLGDGGLRREAAVANRGKAGAEGLRERTMRLMERHYYRLAGRPVSGDGGAI